MGTNCGIVLSRFTFRYLRVNISDILGNYSLFPTNHLVSMKKAEKQVQIILHDSLTDFISLDTENRLSIEVNFELSPAAKDILEARGIPHTAVFKIKVNESPQVLDYNIKNGDIIEAFPYEMVDPDEFDPVFSSPDSFIEDGHLSKLGGYLRLMGLDTLIEKEMTEKEIISFSNKEKRMILTRDLGLLKNGSAEYGYWIRSTNPEQQLLEAFRRFNLKEQIKPFTLCMECNGELNPVDLEEVRNRVPPKVQEWCDEYQQCSKCKKVYWKGSHYDKLKAKVENVLQRTKQ